MSTVYSMQNPTFQNLLMLMSYTKTEEELSELKRVLSDYYARRVEEDLDKLWESGQINNQTLAEWEQTHMRTPYRV